MWKCPQCGEDLHDYDGQCWNCRTKNPHAPAAAAAGATPSLTAPDGQNARKKKCPYCAEEILEEAIKCRFCGSAMPGFEQEIERKMHIPPPSPAAAAAKRPAGASILKKIAIGVLAVVGMVLVAWGAFVVSIPLVKWIQAGGKGVAAAPAAAAAGKDAKSKKGPYEEVTEYDARGNIKKTTRNYE